MYSQIWKLHPSLSLLLVFGFDEGYLEPQDERERERGARGDACLNPRRSHFDLLPKLKQ